MSADGYHPLTTRLPMGSKLAASAVGIQVRLPLNLVELLQFAGRPAWFQSRGLLVGGLEAFVRCFV